MREGVQESVEEDEDEKEEEEREEEEEEEKVGKESHESCATQGGDVSNERVAAGFENHGIIRQIKLERLRPFFPLPYSGPMKWIKPCLSPPPMVGGLF